MLLSIQPCSGFFESIGIFIAMWSFFYFHLFYTGFYLLQSSVAPLHQPLCSVGLPTPGQLWHFLPGWQKFDTQAGVSDNPRRTCKVQNVHFFSLKIKELFPNVKQPTSAFYKSVLGPQMPFLRERCADLWQNFWMLLIPHCQGARHDSALGWARQGM